MVLPKFPMMLVVGLLFVLRGTDSSSSLIRPPQSVGIQHESPHHQLNIPPSSVASQSRNPFQGQDRGLARTDDISKKNAFGPRRRPSALKVPNNPPPISNPFGGFDKPPSGGPPSPILGKITPQLDAYPSNRNDGELPVSQRQHEPYLGEERIDSEKPGFFGHPGSIPGIDNGHKDHDLDINIPSTQSRLKSPTRSPFSSSPRLTDLKKPVEDNRRPDLPGVSGEYLHRQPNPHDYPSPSQYRGQPTKANVYTPSSANNKPDDALSLSGIKEKSKNPLYSSSLAFPKDLKIQQDFPFQSPVAFNRPRSFPPRRSIKPTPQDSLLTGFFTPLDTFGSQSLPVSKERVAAPNRNGDRQSQSNDRHKYPVDTSRYSSSRPNVPNGFAPNLDFKRQNSQDSYDNPYSGSGNISPGSGQCFQYTYPAEAYRLSYVTKGYPLDAIQKEIDSKPHMAPLVGMKAKEMSYNPFSFNSPINSHFGYNSFGFGNEAKPSDKYSYLKNVKAYPGNLQQNDFVGEYPVRMQPLNSACPSEKRSLQSFLYHGGDCFVINPTFQDITYYRCTRRDCNFCGVRRGLSACVETYRWTTVIAYCSRLEDMTRIVPLRLILPVGCTCQHYAC